MSYVNQLDGLIYHMVHFDNLRNIFQRRAILSKQGVLQEKIYYHSIANDEVQGFRDRISILDFSRKRYRSLHSYVPFYFAMRPPMLHNKYNANRTDFYSDLNFLDRLDWGCINNKYRIDPPEEHKRVRHAEVLVPDILPLGQIRGIFVRTQEMVQAVNVLIEESGLKGRIPDALRRISLYF